MPTKTWKAIERKVANKFGTTRTPLSGGNSGHTMSDTLHDRYYIEVKYRKRIPFMTTYKDAVEKAKKEKKIPLVVFKEKGSESEVVMISVDDFLKEI